MIWYNIIMSGTVLVQVSMTRLGCRTKKATLWLIAVEVRTYARRRMHCKFMSAVRCSDPCHRCVERRHLNWFGFAANHLSMTSLEIQLRLEYVHVMLQRSLSSLAFFWSCSKLGCFHCKWKFKLMSWEYSLSCVLQPWPCLHLRKNWMPSRKRRWWLG